MSKTPFFIKLARPTYGRWLLWRHRVKKVGYELLPEEGPFLVLSNHVNFYDPFFISSSMKVHVRWVAGAYLFKNQFLKTLLGRWVGGIAKQQGRSDLQTIRDISAAFKEGEVVGLFPEGTRTWDGEPLVFSEATAKLVRLFRVPVVLINLEGAYALKPRWAKRGRSGAVTIRVVRVLQPEQVRAMSVAALLDLLRGQLAFSHRRWQRTAMIPFRSVAMAEGLERVLYLCPSCGGRSTITTRTHHIRCTACSASWELDPYDTLHPLEHGPDSIQSVADWHRWEKGEIGRLQGSPLFPPDRGVLLQCGVEGRLVTLAKRFTVQLERDRIIVVFDGVVPTGMLKGQKTVVFTFGRMQSMIINVKSTVEFFHEDQLWRIRVASDRSILKYVEWYDALRSPVTDGKGEHA